MPTPPLGLFVVACASLFFFFSFVLFFPLSARLVFYYCRAAAAAVEASWTRVAIEKWASTSALTLHNF